MEISRELRIRRGISQNKTNLWLRISDMAALGCLIGWPIGPIIFMCAAILCGLWGDRNLTLNVIIIGLKLCVSCFIVSAFILFATMPFRNTGEATK